MILYIINPDVLAVRDKRYIDEINLYSLEKTCNDNRFKRAFTLAVNFTMTNFTKLDKKKHLLTGNIIILTIYLGSSSVLSSIIEIIVYSNNDISNKIFADNFSLFFEYTIWFFLKLVLLVREIRLYPYSFLTFCRTESFGYNVSQSFDEFVFFDNRDSLTGLVFTRIQYEIEGMTCIEIKRLYLSKSGRCRSLIPSVRKQYSG